MTELTAKQWQRRALKAEAELESIRKMRQFDHGREMQLHRELAACQVALKEARDAIEWALAQGAT